MKKARILMADDHVLVAEGLRAMLAPAYDVVATVNNGRSLLEAAGTLKPDLIIVDIGMPQLNGLDATRLLKRLLPKVKVIILTMNEDSVLVAEAFRAGANGYLLKYAAPNELLQAIDEVLKGASYLSPESQAEPSPPCSEAPLLHQKRLANSLPASAKSSSSSPKAAR